MELVDIYVGDNWDVYLGLFLAILLFFVINFRRQWCCIRDANRQQTFNSKIARRKLNSISVPSAILFKMWIRSCNISLNQMFLFLSVVELQFYKTFKNISKNAFVHAKLRKKCCQKTKVVSFSRRQFEIIWKQGNILLQEAWSTVPL